MNKYFIYVMSNTRSMAEVIFGKANNFNTYVKSLFMRLTLRERMMFVKQLAMLQKGGVPLLLSLQMLKKQTKSKVMGGVLHQVIRDVENGQYLANALGKFKKVFGELTIHIIAVGEISGTLALNLDHLALSLKKSQSLRQKIVSASVYPIFIIIATVATAIVLTVVIFPKIIPVFKSVNYPLPPTTRFLIFINGAVKSYGLFMVLGVVAGVIGFLLLLRVKKIHSWYDRILLCTPFAGSLIRTYNTANIARTLGLLLGSQVTLVRAFDITSNTTTNILYKSELQKIANDIDRGGLVSSGMQENGKLFPSMVSDMLAVGESTGRLGETFLYLADMYEQDLDDATKNLSTALEPLLLMVMGGLVGFVAISIITPIYGITQHLTPK